MKITTFTILIISTFYFQNISCQILGNKNEDIKPINLCGEPYVRGPLNSNVGSIDTTPLRTGFPGQRSGEVLTPDDMINMQNRQIDPNVIEPGKTRLSDVEGDLTGEHETVVYGADNDAANSNKEMMPLIFIIIIIVLVVWIFIQSKNNKTTYSIEKEATEVFEPSKILSELEKLQSLRQTGVITEEEFEDLKKNILNNTTP
jgi:hypothetical protein